MNKLKTLILLFLILSTAMSYAQTAKIILTDVNPADYEKPKAEILDKVKILVLYKYQIVQDTINPETSKKSYTMELQVGDKIDRYSDYNKNKADSIMWFADLSKKSANDYTNEYLNRQSGTSRNILYINYPSEGKLTESDYVLGGRYEYNENIPKIKWILKPGTEEIAGYDCRKAICYFSGRYYTAWYASEIPISKGPWKFGGLPGLILKIEDNKDQVSWTCIAIEKGDGTHDIIRVDYDPFVTNKKEYHNIIADYNRNKLKWIQASGMVKSSIPNETVKQYPYNAIELEEYKHEKNKAN